MDENSVDSCTLDYDTVIQKCNSIPIKNNSTAVVCVMIANNKSFPSTPLLANGDLSIPPTI